MTHPLRIQRKRKKASGFQRGRYALLVLVDSETRFGLLHHSQRGFNSVAWVTICTHLWMNLN